MKKIIITMLALLFATFSHSVFAKERQDSNIGRYQLFQGEYSFINIKGEQHWSRALFKIDTATGKMFICEQWQIDGKYQNKDGQLIQRRTCKPFEEELVVPK